jgi:E3 ubiquitin-protein ligase DOA10
MLVETFGATQVYVYILRKNVQVLSYLNTVVQKPVKIQLTRTGMSMFYCIIFFIRVVSLFRHDLFPFLHKALLFSVTEMGLRLCFL